MSFFDNQGIFGVTGPYQGALGQLLPVTTAAATTAPAPRATPTTSRPVTTRAAGMTPLPAGTMSFPTQPTPLPKTMIAVPGKLLIKPGLIKAARRRRGAPVTRTQLVPMSLSMAPPNVAQGIVQTSRLPIPGGLPIPSLGGAPQIGFEERAGLWHVSTAAMPVLQQALSKMVMIGDPAGNSFDTTSSFVLSGGGGDAMNKLASYVDDQGYAAMLSKPSVASGSLQITFTKDPAVVVAKAGGPTATHALIFDRPDTLLAAAEDKIAGGPPSTMEKLPSWAVPVGIGVLGLGAVLLMTRGSGKKKGAV
jgi:hypothetical protein